MLCMAPYAGMERQQDHRQCDCGNAAIVGGRSHPRSGLPPARRRELFEAAVSPHEQLKEAEASEIAVGSFSPTC
jgi:hypothetical protein